MDNQTQVEKQHPPSGENLDPMEEEHPQPEENLDIVEEEDLIDFD